LISTILVCAEGIQKWQSHEKSHLLLSARWRGWWRFPNPHIASFSGFEHFSG
jgi:hypothetical protein